MAIESSVTPSPAHLYDGLVVVRTFTKMFVLTGMPPGTPASDQFTVRFVGMIWLNPVPTLANNMANMAKAKAKPLRVEICLVCPAIFIWVLLKARGKLANSLKTSLNVITLVCEDSTGDASTWMAGY